VIWLGSALFDEAGTYATQWDHPAKRDYTVDLVYFSVFLTNRRFWSF
jgi:hypothetical protein